MVVHRRLGPNWAIQVAIGQTAWCGTRQVQNHSNHSKSTPLRKILRAWNPSGPNKWVLREMPVDNGLARNPPKPLLYWRWMSISTHGWKVQPCPIKYKYSVVHLASLNWHWTYEPVCTSICYEWPKPSLREILMCCPSLLLNGGYLRDKPCKSKLHQFPRPF